MRFIYGIPKYKSLNDMPSFKSFLQNGQKEFCGFLRGFLQLDDVRIQAGSLSTLKKWLGVSDLEEIMAVPNVCDEVCLVSQIRTSNGLIAFFPFIIKGYYVGLYSSSKSLLSKVAEAVSDVISLCYSQEFSCSHFLLGESFGKLLVSNCISSKKHNTTEFAHLIEKIEELSVTTFEGAYFTTGVILSENVAKYKKRSLNFQSVKRLDTIDKREWLLANGKETFFLLDQKANSYRLFRKTASTSSDYIKRFFDDYYLASDLKSPDFIVRVVGPNEISISDSDGKEFVKVENVWKYRHHKNLATFLVNQLGIEYKISYAILYYVLKCSRGHVSSIIWIPDDCSLEAIKKFTTANRIRIWNRKLNLLNEEHEVLIDRVLASDGAVVVEKNGHILFDGVFAEMGNPTSTGVLTGSGETATMRLSSNGVAIKISQDGLIKLYVGGKKMVY